MVLIQLPSSDGTPTIILIVPLTKWSTLSHTYSKVVHGVRNLHFPSSYCNMLHRSYTFPRLHQWRNVVWRICHLDGSMFAMIGTYTFHAHMSTVHHLVDKEVRSFLRQRRKNRHHPHNWWLSSMLIHIIHVAIRNEKWHRLSSLEGPMKTTTHKSHASHSDYGPPNSKVTNEMFIPHTIAGKDTPI